MQLCDVTQPTHHFNCSDSYDVRCDKIIIATTTLLQIVTDLYLASYDSAHKHDSFQLTIYFLCLLLNQDQKHLRVSAGCPATAPV